MLRTPLVVAALAAVAVLGTPALAESPIEPWVLAIIICAVVLVVCMGVITIMYCTNSCEDVDLAALERVDSAGSVNSRYPTLTDSRSGSMVRIGSSSSVGSSEYSGGSSRSISSAGSTASSRSTSSTRSSSSNRSGSTTRSMATNRSGSTYDTTPSLWGVAPPKRESKKGDKHRRSADNRSNGSSGYRSNSSSQRSFGSRNSYYV